MACNVYIHLPGISTQQYDQLNEKAGISQSNMPENLIFHMAFEQGGALHISDLWESQQDFEKFFGPLAGLMEDVAGQPVDVHPKYTEVHNYLVGSSSNS